VSLPKISLNNSLLNASPSLSQGVQGCASAFNQQNVPQQWQAGMEGSAMQPSTNSSCGTLTYQQALIP